MLRLLWTVLFAGALIWAEWQGSLAARLELTTAPAMPVRVYLFKDGRPFRLSPVDAVLPLRVDLFYRERVFRRSTQVSTLEVVCNDVSHFLLLRGRGSFDLPQGKYRIEAYRGHFYEPFVKEFELVAGKTETVAVEMKNWLGSESREWLSADDHIHLTRDREDDAVFLAWMEAEDLNVGNFLQLQRQLDAAPQYGFGSEAEARGPGRSIRSGHESRSEFFGHVNLLGGREMLRPLSLGKVYSNGPDTSAYPHILFERGRKVGATVGFAHFDGSMQHSSLPMDLALGGIDFVEVFQFGVLKKYQWYDLLNAGFRVTGIAGSDFPVALSRSREAPDRWLPLLGPERALVRAKAGASAYEAWAAGVRNGAVTVTNGPLVELRREGDRVIARARFYRDLDDLEIIADGKVIARRERGRDLTAEAPVAQHHWIAARTAGSGGIQAHTNPLYLRSGVVSIAARKALAERWASEIAYYRTAPLVFPSERERALFFDRADRALQMLRQ